jgi:hypothetical protein
MGTQGRNHFEFQIQYALSEWARISSVVSKNIEGQKRLFKVIEDPAAPNTGATIEVKLDLFNDDYKQKFIEGSLETYANKLLEKIKKKMFCALTFNGIEDYRFVYQFWYKGRVLTKHVNYYMLTRVS